MLALYGLILGAAIGAVFGLVVHAMQGGRRDFAAVPVVVPSRFELVVDEDAADEAARLIARGAGRAQCGAHGSAGQWPRQDTDDDHLLTR